MYVGLEFISTASTVTLSNDRDIYKRVKEYIYKIVHFLHL